MKDWLGKVLKAGAIWAAVGVVFAALAPALGSLINIPASDLGVIANPKWLGLFFGGTAALAVGLDPVYDRLTGHKTDAGMCRENLAAPSINITLAPDEPSKCACESKHQDYVTTRRNAPPPDIMVRP